MQHIFIQVLILTLRNGDGGGGQGVVCVTLYKSENVAQIQNVAIKPAVLPVLSVGSSKVLS